MKHLVLVIMLLAAAQASAGTEKDALERAAKKYAAEGGLNPGKTPCSCQDGGTSTDGRLGWIRYISSPTAFTIYCGVAGFNATTGDQNIERACYTWVPLAK